MRKFYISVRRDGKIFQNLEKIAFGLDPSANIVRQAEHTVSSSLDDLHVPENGREGFSWKVFSYDGYKYMFVTRSENWMEPA